MVINGKDMVKESNECIVSREAMFVLYHVLVNLLLLTILYKAQLAARNAMLDFTTGCEIGAVVTVSIVYVAGAPSVPLMTALSSDLVTTFEVAKVSATDRIWTLCLRLFLVPIPITYQVLCDFRAKLGLLELFRSPKYSSVAFPLTFLSFAQRG